MSAYPCSALFCYGTLRLAPVMQAVCGHVPDSQPADLADYACHALIGRPYPAIVPRPGGQTPGCVYFDLRPADLRRLDAYEGTLYRREQVRVLLASGSLAQAWTYVLAPRLHHRLSRRPWSLHRFEQKYYKSYLRSLRAA